MALPRWHAAALSAISFGSGAAGLAFELVWLHRAGLVFGNSVWAAAIVLSSFMAGLALGSLLVARAPAWIVRRPLRTYAAAEAVVALTGIALIFVFPHVNGVLRPLFQIATGPGAGNLLRLGSTFALLLVPTTAMGATLPLLVAGTPGGSQHTGRRFGRIYGWNTLGAVAGVLIAEIILIERVGVAGTGCAAGALDLAIAFLAASLSADETRPTRPSAFDATLPSTTRWPLLCAFLSGGLFLALEVLWFRCLGMYVLSTTLAAGIMLAVVLAGIALGGLCASRLLTRGAPRPKTLMTIAALSGTSVMCSYLAFQYGTSGAQVGDTMRLVWFAAILTGPTAFLSGCFLTLLADRIGRELIDPARAVGALALANTIGAALGPPLAAFVLLPGLGMERSLGLIAVVYAFVVARLAVIGTCSLTRVTLAGRIMDAASPIVFFIALVVFAPRNSAVAFARAASAYTADGATVVATREGPSETIFVLQQRWLGQPVYSRLVTNGFSMSGTTIPAMRYMRYFAYWPMLLRQSPVRRALVVCYGVGVTAAAALHLPSISPPSTWSRSHATWSRPAT